VQGIESTGQLTTWVSCAKLNTDKCAIFYAKDSDSDLYVQAITVSGTTISTNSTYSVKVMASQMICKADQLATDTVAVVYNENGSGSVF
jgi:hypothetical protein